jgi:hypothetical protein
MILDRAQQAFNTEDEARGYRLLSLLEDCRVSIRPRSKEFESVLKPLDVTGSAGAEDTPTVFRIAEGSAEWYSPEIGILWED